jgi:hypothetical protein
MTNRQPELLAGHSRNPKVVPLVAGDLQLQLHAPCTYEIDELCGFGSRENPRRPFRHVPTPIGVVDQAARALAEQIPDALPGPVVFVAMAETAIALGYSVAQHWKQRNQSVSLLFAHSTRFAFPDRPKGLSFTEPHSHAPDHFAHLPWSSLANARSLVLVDDERSSGTTLSHAAQALVRELPGLERIEAAVLTDWGADQGLAAPFTTPKTHALLRGTHSFMPSNGRGAQDPFPPSRQAGQGKDNWLSNETGRFGIWQTVAPQDAWLGKLGEVSEQRILVLGWGEFVIAPMLVARMLSARSNSVSFQAVTRSPMKIGLDVVSRQLLEDPYGEDVPYYLYNCDPTDYDLIVFCLEVCNSWRPPTFDHDVRIETLNFSS